mgnify:CR=1 FL=1
MLHPGISKAYAEKRTAALLQEEVHLVAESETPSDRPDLTWGLKQHHHARKNIWQRGLWGGSNNHYH